MLHLLPTFTPLAVCHPPDTISSTTPILPHVSLPPILRGPTLFLYTPYPIHLHLSKPTLSNHHAPSITICSICKTPHSHSLSSHLSHHSSLFHLSHSANLKPSAAFHSFPPVPLRTLPLILLTPHTTSLSLHVPFHPSINLPPSTAFHSSPSATLHTLPLPSTSSHPHSHSHHQHRAPPNRPYPLPVHLSQLTPLATPTPWSGGVK